MVRRVAPINDSRIDPLEINNRYAEIVDGHKVCRTCGSRYPVDYLRTVCKACYNKSRRVGRNNPNIKGNQKLCTNCSNWLDFSKYSSNGGGLRGECKKCQQIIESHRRCKVALPKKEVDIDLLFLGIS